MLRSVDFDERNDMIVNAALVEPMRALVQTALNKSRKAPISPLGKQKITLRDSRTDTIFEICNVMPSRFGRIRRIKSLSTGLFIKEISHKRDGTVVEHEIQTPSHPRAVKAENIYQLRGLKIDSVIETEQALRRATPTVIIESVATDVV